MTNVSLSRSFPSSFLYAHLSPLSRLVADIPLSNILEGIVIVRKNKDYKEKESEKEEKQEQKRNS
jgi:hypothetical protein